MRPRSFIATWGALLFLCSLSLVSGQNPNRPHPKLSHDLADRVAGGSGSELVEVIVQSDGPSLDRVRSKVKRRGAATGRDLPLVDGFVATLPLSEIQSVADEPDVRRISPDRPVASTMDVAAQAADAAWSRSLTPAAGGPTGRLWPWRRCSFGLRGCGLGRARRLGNRRARPGVECRPARV